MNLPKALFATLTLFVFTLGASGDIISVSVPQSSQDFGNNDSYPARDNLWSVSATSNLFDTSLGIGHLLDLSPAALAYDINPATRFGVLHSHKYASPYVPVFNSVETFTFNTPTVVDQLEILQHVNGVTRVEGFIGNEPNSLVSIGNIFGPDGDARGALHFLEGQSYLFDFNNSLAGTIFAFRITQTSLEDGYALHRAFPLLTDGTRISVVPEPVSSSLLGLGVALCVFRRRR